MPISQSPLPYSFDALAPHMSAETLMFHYGKHHAGYVKKLNELIANTPYENMGLKEIVILSGNQKSERDQKIFNNASQSWNHTFFWNCMSSQHDQAPSTKLITNLVIHFGSVNDFVEKFNSKAKELFGSGWTWLVKEPSGDLQVVNYSNADSPLLHDCTPLMTCDVWEHAYYLDYKNDRAAYLKEFWKVVNWSFIETVESVKFSAKDNLNKGVDYGYAH